MKKFILQSAIVLLMVAGFQHVNAQFETVLFEEDFTGIANNEWPEGWSTYTDNAADFIYVNSEKVIFFRQNDEGEMILITPEIDITEAIQMTFDVKRGSGGTTIPQFEIGTMSDPTDPSTYQAIESINLSAQNIWINHTTILEEYTGLTHIAFKEIGNQWDNVDFDNLVITDDPVTTIEFPFEEDFTGIANWELPNGWMTYTDNAMDFVYVMDETLNFFRQNNEGDMLLITPMMDLTTATNVTFEVANNTYSSNIPQFEVGIMADPYDPSTFETIEVMYLESTAWEEKTVYLTTVEGSYHLAFKEIGLAGDFLALDNIVVSDEEVTADWPQPVTSFSAVPGDEGANHAMVSWTNPALQADGDELTELDSVTVEVDDAVYYNLENPVIGESVEVQVDIYEPGFHQFHITAHNSAGSSSSMPTPEIWVGMDTPGVPENITMVATGENSCELTWTAPTEGEHGAYYDGIVTEYMILRGDNVEFIVDGTTFSLLDTVPTPGAFDYAIKAVGTSGEGAVGNSNAVTFYFDGFILYEDFWVSVPAPDWSITSEGDGSEWRYWLTDYAEGTSPEICFYPSDSWTGVSRMISPVLNTEGQYALTLLFKQCQDWQQGSYYVKVETTSDGGSNWEEVWSLQVTEDLPAQEELIVIANNDIGSDNFQFAITMQGACNNVNKFYIDEVRLFPSIDIDMAATEIILPSLVQPFDPVIPVGTVKNYGSSFVEYTAKMEFTDNQNNVVYSSEHTSTLTGGEEEEINFIEWLAQEGEYSVELNVTCDGDENQENDTIFEEMVVYYLIAERTLVVCEEGTGTWCGYCPGAAMGLDELIENDWPVAVVAYHSNDNYETDEGIERLDFYNISSYPSVMFDGTTLFMGGSSSQSMYGNYWPIVQDLLLIPAATSVEVSDIYKIDNTLTAEVELETGSSINNPNLRLHAIITESHIPEAWQNQEELNFVERAMFNGSEGAIVDLSNMNQTITVNFNLDESWNQDNCELVVFVQDMSDQGILNGNKVSLEGIQTGTTDHFKTGIEISIYPNPASGHINISSSSSISTISIYSMLGELVKKEDIEAYKYQMNTSFLESGIYLIKLESESETIAKRIIIE